MLKRAATIFAPALILAAVLVAAYVILLAVNIETVSLTFLTLFPLFAGWIILHFRPKGRMQGFGKTLLWLIGVLCLSLIGMTVSGLEGLVCIAIAIVPLLLGTLAGGLMYLLVIRWRADSKGALKSAIVPVIVIAVLAIPPSPPTTYTLTNEILIDAPVALVFERIKSIPDIRPDEIGTRLSHFLGVRKPTAAIWENRPQGARRHSYWGDEIHFIENITRIETNKRIAWNFEFPEGWAAKGIEDPHVRVGGRYFDVLSGAYRLQPVGSKTRLTLTTYTFDNSGLGAYAEFWHRFFFTDFHEVILDLVKHRAEADAVRQTAPRAAPFTARG